MDNSSRLDSLGFVPFGVVVGAVGSPLKSWEGGKLSDFTFKYGDIFFAGGVSPEKAQVGKIFRKFELPVFGSGSFHSIISRISLQRNVPFSSFSGNFRYFHIFSLRVGGPTGANESLGGRRQRLHRQDLSGPDPARTMSQV